MPRCAQPGIMHVLGKEACGEGEIGPCEHASPIERTDGICIRKGGASCTSLGHQWTIQRQKLGLKSYWGGDKVRDMEAKFLQFLLHIKCLMYLKSVLIYVAVDLQA